MLEGAVVLITAGAPAGDSLSGAGEVRDGAAVTGRPLRSGVISRSAVGGSATGVRAAVSRMWVGDT